MSKKAPNINQIEYYINEIKEFEPAQAKSDHKVNYHTEKWILF